MDDQKLTLLDGGMGRELQKRRLIRAKSVWSATALFEYPDVVREIHEAFIEAGAEVITTSNYGVVPNLLAMEDMADRFDELTQIALDLAVAAARRSDQPVRVAGSLPPLDTSYRADLVGPDEEIEAVYEHLAGRLAAAADLLICETMSSAREARAAARAALSTGKPVWVSWSLREAADGRLRSGETTAEAVRALDGLPVTAFLFNCCSPESIDSALPALRAATDRPIGAYANTFKSLPEDYVMGQGEGEDGETPLRGDMGVQRYVDSATSWRAAGASVIGGCCGIGPDYIAALQQNLS